jgi:DNA-binding NtrC family response regulator
MDSTPIHILLVEDNPGDARLLGELLKEDASARCEMTHVDRLAQALGLLPKGGVDVVLLDLTLPDAQGLEGLDRVRRAAPALPVVVLTGHNDQRMALGAVERGAQDYLVKGQVEAKLLVRSLRYAIQRTRADEAARRSAVADAERQRLFSLLMQAPVAICVLTGPARTFELANPLFCRLVGRDGLVGLSLESALPGLLGACCGIALNT